MVLDARLPLPTTGEMEVVAYVEYLAADYVRPAGHDCVQPSSGVCSCSPATSSPRGSWCASRNASRACLNYPPPTKMCVVHEPRDACGEGGGRRRGCYSIIQTGEREKCGTHVLKGVDALQNGGFEEKF